MNKVSVRGKRASLTKGIRANKSCICRGHCVCACNRKSIDPKVK